jgi:molybdopterin synthase sulfur carrier subunit
VDQVPVSPADDRVVVVLPTALMRLFPGCEREPVVVATSVKEMVEALNMRWPGMRDRICDSTPRVRRHINIFVEGKRATLDTPLAPGMEVFIMTAISGG